MKKSNINCAPGSCTSDDRMAIFPGDRIETGKKAKVSIILNDGTALVIYERSDITIYSIYSQKEKTLASIFSDFGKFKIIQNNSLIDTSLTVKTRNALIKSVCSSLSIVSSENETGIFVYKGEAGFANTDPSIQDAYIVKSGFESFLQKSTPPSLPVKVKIDARSSWHNKYFISEDNSHIIRYSGRKGPVDWFFTNKK